MLLLEVVVAAEVAGVVVEGAGVAVVVEAVVVGVVVGSAAGQATNTKTGERGGKARDTDQGYAQTFTRTVPHCVSWAGDSTAEYSDAWPSLFRCKQRREQRDRPKAQRLAIFS